MLPDGQGLQRPMSTNVRFEPNTSEENPQHPAPGCHWQQEERGTACLEKEVARLQKGERNVEKEIDAIRKHERYGYTS